MASISTTNAPQSSTVSGAKECYVYEIFINRATGLKNDDVSDTIDPYIKVRIGDQNANGHCIFVTQTQTDKRNPVWNEKTSYLSFHRIGKFTFEIVDHNASSTDAIVKTQTLAVADFQDDKADQSNNDIDAKADNSKDAQLAYTIHPWKIKETKVKATINLGVKEHQFCLLRKEEFDNKLKNVVTADQLNNFATKDQLNNHAAKQLDASIKLAKKIDKLQKLMDNLKGAFQKY